MWSFWSSWCNQRRWLESHWCPTTASFCLSWMFIRMTLWTLAIRSIMRSKRIAPWETLYNLRWRFLRNTAVMTPSSTSSTWFRLMNLPFYPSSFHSPWKLELLMQKLRNLKTWKLLVLFYHKRALRPITLILIKPWCRGHGGFHEWYHSKRSQHLDSKPYYSLAISWYRWSSPNRL